MAKNKDNKERVFLLSIILCTSMATCAQTPSARFIPENLSMQNAGKTREFKGLNFSMNKSGKAIAVWAVSDPDAGPAIQGAIQAAYFDGAIWILPGLNDFISDITSECELPWVYLNDNGQAVAVWQQVTDKKICANRFVNMIWQGLEDVADLDAGTGFRPERSRVRVGVNNDANPKAFVIWVQKNNDAQDTDTLFYSTNNGILAAAWENKIEIPAFVGNSPIGPAQISFSPFARALCVGDNVVFITYSLASVFEANESSTQWQAYYFANNTLVSAVVANFNEDIGLPNKEADGSCSNDNKNVHAYQDTSVEDVVTNISATALKLPEPSMGFVDYMIEMPEGEIEKLLVASGVNDSADVAFLQIQTNKAMASTLLYFSKAIFGTGSDNIVKQTLLSNSCLSFDGLNDIPQLCMNNRGDGAFVYYNEPASSTNGKIMVGGFRKKDSGIFTCAQVPYELKGAMLKTRTEVGSNVPFYLDCSRNEGGQNNANGGIIWWDETDQTKIIRSLIVQNTNTPFLPSSPTNLKGQCLLHRFADRAEYFDQLTWDPATDQGISKQRVTRNGEVISELSPTQDSFVDHNRPPGIQDEYGIVTVVSTFGQELSSVPATIVLNC